jgi:serine/threonine protein phosphatase PrpC
MEFPWKRMKGPGASPATPQPREVFSATLEKMRFSVGAKTVAGVRPDHENEDAIFSLPERGAFGVFDGVGGGPGGKLVSNTARDYVEKSLEALPQNLSLEAIKGWLEKIFDEAHKIILQETEKDTTLVGMATTASIVQFWQDKDGKKKIVIANAGDSRVYILRSRTGILEQITLDDSQINFVLKEVEKKSEKEMRAIQTKFNNVTEKGNLTENEQVLWKSRNIILNSIGGAYGCSPNIYVEDVEDGDMVYISSDGISDCLTDNAMAEIIKGKGDNQSKVEALIAAAKKVTQQGDFRAKNYDDDKAGILISALN